MAQSFTVGDHKSPCLDKELDLGTHLIEGPRSFASMAELFGLIMQKSVFSLFPTAEPITVRKWLECGTVSLTKADGANGLGLILNGESKPVEKGFSDDNGIYPYTTIEIPDGCCYWVNMCVPYRARSITKDAECDGQPLTCNGEPLTVTAAVAC